MSHIELGVTTDEGTTVELAQDELHPQNVQFFEVLDQKMHSLSCADRLELLDKQLQRDEELRERYNVSEHELLLNEDLTAEALEVSVSYLRQGRRIVEERELELLARYERLEERIYRRQQKLARTSLSNA